MRSLYGVEKAGPTGQPGLPSSSSADMPKVIRRLDKVVLDEVVRRACREPLDFGKVENSLGDSWEGGGEYGPRMAALG